jgi:hypothetical protein
MGIITRSLADVQCDLCKTTRTVELDPVPTGQLNDLGYRRVKLTIEPPDPRFASQEKRQYELIACVDCLAKLTGGLHLSTPEDDAERELREMKLARG